MNILIYGAGAVGLGIASCLIKQGESADLIGRGDTVDALRRNGLRRTGIFGELHAPPDAFGVFDSVITLPGKTYDFILVCTKSFDSAGAARQIASVPYLYEADTPLVLCQNGWGNAEIFAGHFPHTRIKNGRVITGFRRPQLHQVDITVHADALHLGSLFDDAVAPLEPLARAIDAGGIPCAVTHTVSRDLWAKMLYNCMLNALSTIHDVPYGHLGDSPHTRELMEDVAHEVFAVMKAAGYDTHWTSAQEYIDVFYKKQLPPTYDHEPSMLQDVRAGRRTEIDALNGAVVQLGQQHGVPTPANATLTRMIRFMESGTPR
ncbi:MAG: 2-dehydropantoate 2-reductase [Nitrospinaceae bacterium]|nr:2-dehydropantoate 2-reductase [Nitrospinaceae bacterium]NIR54564.1 2-dehydropantoate 2-reductase [Nitrospinaceae bacterium]NIS84983.1 2-dehydropantoate 2-reductase [Nitrospinaceae bacterium]NIT81794.1 2-dehydropantoate 2-reductase [Nitrospinaceae bacterium]NIU46284.1 2-dehydropantoate 2-reductase [Nitrospinaceae bacterium]